MTGTAHDQALEDERALQESFGRLLALMRERHLRFPLSVGVERFAPLGPRLRLQVEDVDFRDYFEQIDNRVMRTEEHEGQVHVHVEGVMRGRWVHMIAVLRHVDACKATPDGWCKTHSSQRGPTFCVPDEDSDEL